MTKSTYSECDELSAPGWEKEHDHLRQEALLVSRGVRAISPVGACNEVTVDEVTNKLRIIIGEGFDQGYPVDYYLVPSISPGVMHYGFSCAPWAVSLFSWAMQRDFPKDHFDPILGLLFGYSLEAISRCMGGQTMAVRAPGAVG